MQIEGTSSRDVQLLLWAVGQARDEGRQQVRECPATLEDLAAAGGSDFFTEWQPAGGPVTAY